MVKEIIKEKQFMRGDNRMDILITLVAFATTFFFIKMVFHSLKYLVNKVKKKDVSLIKKKVKKSGILLVICYVSTIILGVMAGSAESVYKTVDTEANVKEESVHKDVKEEVDDAQLMDEKDITSVDDEIEMEETTESVADFSMQEGEEQQEEYYSEEEYDEEYEYEEESVYEEQEYYDEFEIDEDIEAKWEEDEYTVEQMEEKASTYTTLLTYTYENSRQGKKIKELVEESQNAESEEFCYVLEKSKLTSNKKTYEMTIDSDAEYMYFGKTKKNKPDGYGILYHDRYPVYIGEFKKGVKNGYGIEIVESDLYDAYFIAYEGEFKDGVREGDGKEYTGFVEGTMLDSYYYAVDMYRKKALKYGDLRYDIALIGSVEIYHGEFQKGKYSGEGVYYYRSGQVMYEGTFEYGSFNGKGTLYYGDGQIWYKGEFKNDKYHGKGTLYSKEGEVQYKGKFKNGDIE